MKLKPQSFITVKLSTAVKPQISKNSNSKSWIIKSPITCSVTNNSVLRRLRICRNTVSHYSMPRHYIEPQTASENRSETIVSTIKVVVIFAEKEIAFFRLGLNGLF